MPSSMPSQQVNVIRLFHLFCKVKKFHASSLPATLQLFLQQFLYFCKLTTDYLFSQKKKKGHRNKNNHLKTCTNWTFNDDVMCYRNNGVIFHPLEIWQLFLSVFVSNTKLGSTSGIP